MQATQNEKSRALREAEKMLRDLERRRDGLIVELSRPHDGPEEDRLLLEVVKVARQVYALVHDLAEATGDRMKFRARWDVHYRLTDFQSRRARRLTAGGALPRVETPWRKLIEKIRPHPDAAPEDAEGLKRYLDELDALPPGGRVKVRLEELD